MLLTLVTALTSTALARLSNQAGSVGLILGFVMAGISGCIPISATPLFRSAGLLSVLAALTPHGHALEGYYRLMAEKATLFEVLPQIGIVLILGIVFFLVAQWRFRYE